MLTYEDLTDAEQAVWGAIATGVLVELPIDARASDDESPSENGKVRAQLLCELVTGRIGPKDTHPRALKLAGAQITGVLDLEAATLVGPLVLRGCSFEQPISLQGAQAPAVRLSSCEFPALNARQLETRGDLDLSGCASHGAVDLRAAHVGGDLDLTGATLTNPDGVALVADGMTVDQSMLCTAGFTARGEVALVGARVGGDLVLTGAKLVNPGKRALTAPRLSVGGALFCGKRLGSPEGFAAHGEVRLAGARVGAFASFAGATLANPDGAVLQAPGLTVGMGLFCSEGFTAHGEVNLVGARIGLSLDFTGATLVNPGKYALNASRLSVGQAMFCGHQIGHRGGFTARGQVRLVDAHVGAFLTFEGASLEDHGWALAADRLAVDQDLYCAGGFRATGGVRLLDAHAKSLVCSGGTFANADGPALAASGLSVDRDVVLREGFTARGEVDLAGARIGGTLDCTSAAFAAPDGPALSLQRLHAQALVLLPRQAPDGPVDLTHAHVGVLADGPEAWPEAIALRGFVYDALDDQADEGVAARLRWLERDPGGYAPQPYEQLASAYRRAGHDEAAQRVAVAKQRRRRRTLGRPAKAWSALLDVTVGYGYRTWQAGLWLLGFLLVGWMVFAHAHPVPAKPGEPQPGFQPLVYALDTLLPVVNLHQQDNWIPRGAAQWWAWTSILAGWVLTTAIVAALTGLLKRD